MRTALIIGASRGIGHEFARELLASGWKVFATARDDVSVAALRTAGAEALKLDVTNTESISGLAWQLDGVEFDLALYVAGVYGPQQGATSAPTTGAFDQVMHTNVLGAMQLIPTVAPMVEAARGKFVFISSGLGSISQTMASEGWLYRVSKAALNMAVRAASFDYPKAIMVSMSPGWVKTEMGGPDATLTVEQSVSSMLRVIESLTPQDTGTFRKYDGSQAPW